MPFTVNKKKYNHLKAHRTQRRSIKNSQPKRSEEITSQTVNNIRVPLSRHQVKALKVNPKTHLGLSKKSQKKLQKRARITEELLLKAEGDGAHMHEGCHCHHHDHAHGEASNDMMQE